MGCKLRNRTGFAFPKAGCHWGLQRRKRSAYALPQMRQGIGIYSFITDDFMLYAFQRPWRLQYSLAVIFAASTEKIASGA